MTDTGCAVDVRMEKLLEYERSRAERQEAMVEYVAVMADVELPDMEGEADE